MKRKCCKILFEILRLQVSSFQQLQGYANACLYTDITPSLPEFSPTKYMDIYLQSKSIFTRQPCEVPWAKRHTANFYIVLTKSNNRIQIGKGMGPH